MKIVYCITRSDTIGGAHIHVADMASWMISQGNEALVVLSGDGPYCDFLTYKGIPYETCKHLTRPIHFFKDLFACFELRSKIKKLRPDIISLHSSKAGILGRFASSGLGVPVLFTAHGWSFTEGVPEKKARLFKILERFSARFANLIITVSEFDRLLGLHYGIGSEEKLVAIHNGMPDINDKARPEQTDGPVQIIMVARLDEQKDHQTLIKALSLINHLNWSLVLVGDGPKENQIKGQAKKNDFSDRIQFLGLRTDVGKLLSQANIFVLITNWEGFPRSILEAMRAGLPVIASNVGGVSEAVQEGETGYLVPKGNAEVLAERISRLISSPEERSQMGRAGRMRFQDNFLFERMAEQTFQLYQNLIKKK